MDQENPVADLSDFAARLVEGERGTFIRSSNATEEGLAMQAHFKALQETLADAVQDQALTPQEATALRGHIHRAAGALRHVPANVPEQSIKAELMTSLMQMDNMLADKFKGAAPSRVGQPINTVTQPVADSITAEHPLLDKDSAALGRAINALRRSNRAFLQGERTPAEDGRKIGAHPKVKTQVEDIATVYSDAIVDGRITPEEATALRKEVNEAAEATQDAKINSSNKRAMSAKTKLTEDLSSLDGVLKNTFHGADPTPVEEAALGELPQNQPPPKMGPRRRGR